MSLPISPNPRPLFRRRALSRPFHADLREVKGATLKRQERAIASRGRRIQCTTLSQPSTTCLPPSGGTPRTATRAPSGHSMTPCPTTFPNCAASSRTASSTSSGSAKRPTASRSRSSSPREGICVRSSASQQLRSGCVTSSRSGPRLSPNRGLQIGGVLDAAAPSRSCSSRSCGTRASPARVHTGVALYLDPSHPEDHYVTEFWNAAERRWQMADGRSADRRRSTQGDATHR